MAYKNFTLKVTATVIIMAITSVGFLWTFQKPFFLVTNISLAMLWIIEILYLIYVVRRTNRDLALFMESIKFDDDTLLFRKGEDKSFDKLYDEFNRIIGELSNARAAKEIENQYFLNTVTHVPIGLISFDDDGNIEIFNSAAEKLLGLSSLRNIKDLNKLNPGLADHIFQIETGKHEVIKVRIGQEMQALLIRGSKFKLDNTNIKLVSIQDIRPELEEEEIVAWQKLIRVLTHEIINSVSPISLLSSSLIKELEALSQNPPKGKATQVRSWMESLEAIQKRSEGLKRFVENYKSIAKVPETNFASVSIKELIEQVHILLKRDMEKQSIVFSFKVQPASLKVTADERLLEQVLINLVKNAMQSFSSQDKKSIKIAAFEVNGSACIQVEDNGPGIPESEIDNVFLPFYTTKPEGSGIGLNLSKQIMRAHKGKLTLESREGETVFSLIF